MDVRLFVRLALISLLLVGCHEFSDPDPNYRYTVPETGSEFVASSLEEQGVDESLIESMTDKVVSDDFKRIHAVIILKNDKVVYENYFHGYASDIPHNIYSSTKSVISILTGIAIEKGFIPDLSTPILSLLPEYDGIQYADPRKYQITVGHLLNMSSGLDCDDWIAGTDEEASKEPDPVKYILDLPMINDPGSAGVYCTGGVWLLMQAIQHGSGMAIDAFADKFLFSALGITNARWIDRKLFLRPRDMAKIGQLMLRHGNWNGEQVLAAAWVEQSAETQIKLPGPFDGYGFLWWKQKFKGNIQTYFASGNGGQEIFVFPTENMVVVFTSGNKNTSLGLQNIYMLRDYIIPALK